MNRYPSSGPIPLSTASPPPRWPAALSAILVAAMLVSCGASYWLREIERAEGLQLGAERAQGARQAELDRLGAAVCNGHADRYASLAQHVLQLRADVAGGRARAQADLAKAEEAAGAARRKMDGICAALGIQPAPRTSPAIPDRAVPAAELPDAGVHRDLKPDMAAADGGA